MSIFFSDVLKASCPHVDGILFRSPETFPDHPVIRWCTCCGCLLDAKTDEIVAGPSDYRIRWIT